MNTESIAKEIFSYIKDEISNKKKQSKENAKVIADIDIEYYDTMRGGNKGYTIEVNGKRFNHDLLPKYDFTQVASKLLKMLKELSNTKGWKNLVISTEEVNFSESWYRTNYYDIVNNVRLLNEPCKEFKSLANYVQKYCGITINMKDIYNVAIGGKRGRVYGEEGQRWYLAHKPNKCAEILSKLRENRATKDIVTSVIKSVDDIDEDDLRYSIKYETEFNGARLNMCEVTIKTPKGKVKKVIQITA